MKKEENVNWKILAAAMLVLLAAGCGAKTAVTVENALGEWEITELSLKNPDGTETPLTPMPLAAGGTMVLSLAPGEYTLSATDAEDYDYSVAFTVAAEDMTVKIGFNNSLGFEETISVADGVYWSGTGAGLISITNTLGDYPIYWVSVVEAGGDLYWDSTEYCQSIIVYEGETLNILIEPGTYDIQIEDIDGDTYTRYGVEITREPYEWSVNLDEMDAPADVPEGTAPVTIYNDLGDWSIWYIQCDPTTSAWGDDRLGSEILAPGDEFTFYVAPGAYDIRCEDEDGDTYTVWGVEIPETGYYWAVTLDQMD
jgi:hypothetical protein